MVCAIETRGSAKVSHCHVPSTNCYTARHKMQIVVYCTLPLFCCFLSMLLSPLCRPLFQSPSLPLCLRVLQCSSLSSSVSCRRFFLLCTDLSSSVVLSLSLCLLKRTSLSSPVLNVHCFFLSLSFGVNFPASVIVTRLAESVVALDLQFPKLS